MKPRTPLIRLVAVTLACFNHRSVTQQHEEQATK